MNTTSSYMLVIQEPGEQKINGFFDGYRDGELKDSYLEYTIYNSIEAVKRDRDATSLTGLIGAKRFLIQLSGDVSSITQSMMNGTFSHNIIAVFNYDDYLRKQRLNQEPNPVLVKAESKPDDSSGRSFCPRV
jgi:hypothetical protein